MKTAIPYHGHPLYTHFTCKSRSALQKGTIYPYAERTDLRPDVITRVRKMASSCRRTTHGGLWVTLTFWEVLSCIRDFQTGKDGFTLAAILLFGKDETILSVVPHLRIDAITRRDSIDRYDDRDDIAPISSKSLWPPATVGKHLNDPFYLENDRRISLLRPYFTGSNQQCSYPASMPMRFPAKFIIDRDKFSTENSNKPHGHGMIDPSHLRPIQNSFYCAIVQEVEGRMNLGLWCSEPV